MPASATQGGHNYTLHTLHSIRVHFYGCPMEQGRPLYFCPVVSFFLFSSPNFSGPRLDVYHTSTRGVALVRISNAGLKCAARGSLEMQDAKNRQKIAKNSLLGTIVQLCGATSSQLRHVLTIGKKQFTQQYLPHMSSQYDELWPTSG